MKIAFGCDHAAHDVRETVLQALEAAGQEVLDLGTLGQDSVDYPDFAEDVALSVAHGRAERGVLLCGTGIGMSIAANKVPGVRAALCHDAATAELSRRHNDANVLCMGARLTSADGMREILRIWLATPFEGGRHARRVEKIGGIEARVCRGEQEPRFD